MPIQLRAAQPKDFFEALFAPTPEIKAAHQKYSVVKKDGLDYISDYVSTSRGAKMFFWLLREPCFYLARLSFLCQGKKEKIGKITHVLTAAGYGLSLPRLVPDSDALRKSVAEVQRTAETPYSDPLRSQKIARSYKNTAIDGLNLTNTAAEAGLFLHQVQLLACNTPQLRLLNILYNGTTLLSDGADFITQGYRLEQLDKLSNSRRPNHRLELENKKTLAQATRIQEGSSVAVAGIELGTALFGVSLETMPILSGCALGLGTVWVISTIFCHLFEKTVAENNSK